MNVFFERFVLETGTTNDRVDGQFVMIVLTNLVAQRAFSLTRPAGALLYSISDQVKLFV